MNQHGHVHRRSRLSAGLSNVELKEDGRLARPAGRDARPSFAYLTIGLAAMLVLGLSSCSGGRNEKVEASAQQAITVGVTHVVKKTLSRQITLSSELVPFQEIDVYAKESGYVQKLDVDYGSHVKTGQVMATLEIPELEAQLQEDQAEIKNAMNQVSRADNELKRYDAQYQALHLQYTRLNQVFQTQPGIVAQQEVDDAQGKDLAAASQVDAGKAALEAAQSQLAAARAKLAHDQTLYDYSKITAPFAGVVTERYANLGTLVQAGTNSSTQAMPIVTAVAGRSVSPGHSHSRVVRSLHPYRRSGECSRAFPEPDVPGQSGTLLGGCEGGHSHHAHRSGCSESSACVDARPLRRSGSGTR